MATIIEGAKNWDYFSLRESDWESLPENDAILVGYGKSVDIAPRAGIDFRVYTTSTDTAVEFLTSFLPDEINIQGNVVIEDSQMPRNVVYKLEGPGSVLRLKERGTGELRITNIPDFILSPKFSGR